MKKSLIVLAILAVIGMTVLLNFPTDLNDNLACGCLKHSDLGKIEENMVKEIYIVNKGEKVIMDEKQQKSVINWINKSDFGEELLENEDGGYNHHKKIDTSVYIEIEFKFYKMRGDKTLTLYKAFSEHPKEKDGYIAVYGGVIHEVTINDENKEEEIALYKYLKTL